MENAIETKEIEITGHRYLITHPQVERAWEIGVELSKLVGPSAAAMSQVGDNKDLGKVLTDSVSLLLQKIEPKASMLLIKKILSSVEAQGPSDGSNKKILLDENGIKIHFQGKIGSMMKLAGETIAFTHADFFEAIADGIAAMMKKASDKTAA